MIFNIWSIIGAMKAKLAYNREEGFIAIFSVLIIMAILGLLTIGFSNITRQAQRRTLDNQLSAQAFYAAESGVNRAAPLIRDGIIATSRTSCDSSEYATQLSPEIDPELEVGITCLLIDMTPPSLADTTSEDDPTFFYLGTSDPLNTLRVSWDSKIETGLPSATNTQFPTNAAWGNNVSMLRVDVVPSSALDSRNNMVNNSRTFFLYPTSSPAGVTTATVAAGPDRHGDVILTQCSGDYGTVTYRCSAEVGLGPNSSNGLSVRIQAYYNIGIPTNIEVEGSSSLVGWDQRFEDGQAVIDVTGRATDVHRRIQVRMPIGRTASYRAGLHLPYALLSADSICKQLVAIPPPAVSVNESAVAACAP